MRRALVLQTDKATAIVTGGEARIVFAKDEVTLSLDEARDLSALVSACSRELGPEASPTIEAFTAERHRAMQNALAGGRGGFGTSSWWPDALAAMFGRRP